MVAFSFQKIVADVLGLKLTRAEQEQQQPVMQAEILHTPASVEDGQIPNASHLTPAASSKSAICEIQ
ncbi:Ras-related protein Rab-28 [Blattella germanica]|nr:Ras-related protein Rab-28 [Blattella germanica]